MTEYTLCKHCNHFVLKNEKAYDNNAFMPVGYSLAEFVHLDDGEQEFDHDAEPGETHSKNQWKQFRPDLFTRHPDGNI